MGLFGRRKKADPEPVRSAPVDEEIVDEGDDFELSDRPDGPYDEHDAPDDALPRLDLGSVRVPVPDGAQIQVQMSPDGQVEAINVLTPVCQLTVNAYAAPKSGGLWREVMRELADNQRTQGATVRTVAGEWGNEITASREGMLIRLVGVDGPRWMLRGVAVSPTDTAEVAEEALREMLRGTVVVRGNQPMPVGNPLQIDLPQAIAEHIAQAQEQQA